MPTHIRSFEVDALRVTPETTDEEIAAFDRDFRVPTWMRRAGGWLVKRGEHGTSEFISEAVFSAEFTAIVSTWSPGAMVKRLAQRGLSISEVELVDALAILDSAGIKDEDASTSLFRILSQASPWARATHGVRNPFVAAATPLGSFIGWLAFADELRTLPMEELFVQFGSDAIRAVSVIRERVKG